MTMTFSDEKWPPPIRGAFGSFGSVQRVRASPLGAFADCLRRTMAVPARSTLDGRSIRKSTELSRALHPLRTGPRSGSSACLPVTVMLFSVIFWS